METNSKILQIIKSKTFIAVIAVFFGLALLVGTFTLGVFVGYKKANFSYRWGENYHRNFGGPRDGFFGNIRDFGGKDFIEGHGIFGQIIKIDGQTIIVKGRDNVERILLVKEDTSIQRFHDAISIGELRADDYIVVLGNPKDSGQIEAKFIRVMPGPSPTMH